MFHGAESQCRAPRPPGASSLALFPREAWTQGQEQVRLAAAHPLCEQRRHPLAPLFLTTACFFCLLLCRMVLK